MAIKKLIATTVSSREIGLKRREEGKTELSKTDSNTRKPTNQQKHQRKNVDGDVPACMKRKALRTTQKKRRLEKRRRRRTTTQVQQCRRRHATVSAKN